MPTVATKRRLEREAAERAAAANAAAEKAGEPRKTRTRDPHKHARELLAAFGAEIGVTWSRKEADDMIRRLIEARKEK